MLAAPLNICGNGNPQSVDIHHDNKDMSPEHMHKIFLRLGVLTAATSFKQTPAIAMPSLPVSVCTGALALARYWMDSDTTPNTSSSTSRDPASMLMASRKNPTKNGREVISHKVHGISDDEALDFLVARIELEISDFDRPLDVGA